MMNADFSEARRKERHEENQYDELAHGLADPGRGFAFDSDMNLMKMGMRGDQRLQAMQCKRRCASREAGVSSS